MAALATEQRNGGMGVWGSEVFEPTAPRPCHRHAYTSTKSKFSAKYAINRNVCRWSPRGRLNRTQRASGWSYDSSLKPKRFYYAWKAAETDEALGAPGSLP